MCVYCQKKMREQVNVVADVDCKMQLASVEITRGDVIEPIQTLKLTAEEARFLVKELMEVTTRNYEEYSKMCGAA